MSVKHDIDTLYAYYHAANSRGETGEALTILDAISYLDRWVPAAVEKPGEWDEAKCPTCGESLSTHEGDGIYTHRKWMEYCPNDECHQKLVWF